MTGSASECCQGDQRWIFSAGLGIFEAIFRIFHRLLSTTFSSGLDAVTANFEMARGMRKGPMPAAAAAVRPSCHFMLIKYARLDLALPTELERRKTAPRNGSLLTMAPPVSSCHVIKAGAEKCIVDRAFFLGRSCWRLLLLVKKINGGALLLVYYSSRLCIEQVILANIGPEVGGGSNCCYNK